MKNTSRSGSGNVTGFNRTVLTTEKIAVFDPIPSASAAIAAAVNPRLWPNMRNECLRSFKESFHPRTPRKYRRRTPGEVRFVILHALEHTSMQSDERGLALASFILLLINVDQRRNDGVRTRNLAIPSAGAQTD